MHRNTKSKVVELSVDEIRPNPAQPRRTFNEQELRNLSQSIRVNGLIQPLLVRKLKDGYELVAGERRLRACRMAGLKKVSCIISDCSAGTSAVLALAENLQRQDLQVFEEAEGIRRLIEEWHVTQEEAAFRLGKSQSALANKLRLLRLTGTERQKITAAGLTERHARALLRIEDQQLREKILNTIIEKHLNVQETDRYVEKCLERKEVQKQKRTAIVKDVRIFLNTISHAVGVMKQSGIDAQALRSESDEYIEYVVRIPKTEAFAGGKKPA